MGFPRSIRFFVRGGNNCGRNDSISEERGRATSCMSNRCVVTGGAGFIGSNLVSGLLAAGEERVTVIDNLITGHAKNLDGLGGRADLQRVDIRNYDEVLRALRG